MPRSWIDISVPLRNGMVVWPGDPPVRIENIASIARGDTSNLSAISCCLHTGTHVDAPLHYFNSGAAMEKAPVSALAGVAHVIGIRHVKSIQAAELKQHRIQHGEIVLFKTQNSSRCWGSDEFCADYVFVARDAAEYLVERGVRTVGIDYLSIGAPDDEGDEVHRILLGAGVWIIEGVDLSRAEPGRYDLVCLPLNIPGADGAPARAMLRRRR